MAVTVRVYRPDGSFAGWMTPREFDEPKKEVHMELTLARQKRRELEDAIYNLLKKYSDETGAIVVEVQVLKTQSFGGIGPEIAQVIVRVEL